MVYRANFNFYVHNIVPQSLAVRRSNALVIAKIDGQAIYTYFDVEKLRLLAMLQYVLDGDMAKMLWTKLFKYSLEDCTNPVKTTNATPIGPTTTGKAAIH